MEQILIILIENIEVIDEFYLVLDTMSVSSNTLLVEYELSNIENLEDFLKDFLKNKKVKTIVINQ